MRDPKGWSSRRAHVCCWVWLHHPLYFHIPRCLAAACLCFWRCKLRQREHVPGVRDSYFGASAAKGEAGGSQGPAKAWKARKEKLAFLWAWPALPMVALAPYRSRLTGILWTFSSFLVYLSSRYQQQNYQDEDRYGCHRKQAKGHCPRVQRGPV